MPRKPLSAPVIQFHMLVAAAYGERMGGSSALLQELVRLGWVDTNGNATPLGDEVLDNAVRHAANYLVDRAANGV